MSARNHEVNQDDSVTELEPSSSAAATTTPITAGGRDVDGVKAPGVGKTSSVSPSSNAAAGHNQSTSANRRLLMMMIAFTATIALSTLILSGPFVMNISNNSNSPIRWSNVVFSSSRCQHREEKATEELMMAQNAYLTLIPAGDGAGQATDATPPSTTAVDPVSQCSAPAPSKPQVALPGMSPRELPAPLRLDIPHCQLLQILPHELRWYVTGRVARTDHIYPNSISFDWPNVRIDAALSVTPIGTPFTVSVVLIYPCTDSDHESQKLHVKLGDVEPLTIFTAWDKYRRLCNHPVIIPIPLQGRRLNVSTDITIMKATEANFRLHADSPDNSVTFVGFYIQAQHQQELSRSQLAPRDVVTTANLSLVSRVQATRARSPDIRHAYHRIHWVGASIFCGLQILCPHDGLPVKPALEDATVTYAARTCDALNDTKCNFMCWTGRGLTRGPFGHIGPAIPEMYDWVRATSPDRQVAHDEDTPPDLVILNLGMNDLKGPDRRHVVDNYLKLMRQIITKYTTTNTNLSIIMQCGPNGHDYCNAMRRATTRTRRERVANKVFFQQLPGIPKSMECFNHPNIEYSKVLTEHMLAFLTKKGIVGNNSATGSLTVN